jgi:NADH dehydrogenase
MNVLVTGGTGVIGLGVIQELKKRAHHVRLLSRHAEEDAKRWADIEAHEGDVSDAASLREAASGCDAVIHIAGIASEQPPEITFDRVNVEGTRNLIAEASRAGARRFIFISSLGADRGKSDYHASKRNAEALVRESELAWSIVRPGNVYGPGDEVISTMLKLVRSLPAVPMIDRGDQPFQPVWYEDLASAIATLAEDRAQSGNTLEIAGEEVTTMHDLFSRLSTVTGRSPVRIPIPMPLASLATRLSDGLIDLPVDDNKLAMLAEENVIEGADNALRSLLGHAPTTLDAGLRMLADALLEQLPEHGVGAMEHKSFWAQISGSRLPAASLMSEFRTHLNDVMPLEFAAEPGSSTTVERGETITGALPLRGNFQVRVEEAEPTRILFATVEGHPLAGTVEFTTRDLDGGVRFQVDIRTRASNMFDLVAVRTLGAPMQSANWRAVVQRVVDLSGGTTDGVHDESRKLDEDEAHAEEDRVRSIVQRRQREQSAAPSQPSQR